MRRFTAVLATSMVALALFGVGCSSDDNNGGPVAGSFYGLYADALGLPATITLTGVTPATAPQLFGGTASTPMSGTLDISGQLPIELIGLYFPDTGTLSFASDDDAYAFNGQVTLGTASGSSTGPNGPGTFVLFTGGTPATAAVYCGAATCDPGACETDVRFNLAVSNSIALLTIFAGESVGSAVGTRTGDNVSLHVTDKGTDVTVQGTLNGNSVGGTWFDAVSNGGGLWNGNTGQCSAGAR